MERRSEEGNGKLRLPPPLSQIPGSATEQILHQYVSCAPNTLMESNPKASD